MAITIIKAIASKDGYQDSDIMIEVYDTTSVVFLSPALSIGLDEYGYQTWAISDDGDFYAIGPYIGSIGSNDYYYPDVFKLDSTGINLVWGATRQVEGFLFLDDNGQIYYYGSMGYSSTIPKGDRGIFAGGQNGSSINTIEYVTIMSMGNTTDFGDLTDNRYALDGTSNRGNERAVFMGGNDDIVNSNIIDYITINSIGDATDFGDTLVAKRLIACTSNGTNERGVCGGGYTSTEINTIDYVTINSQSNSTDFGDLLSARQGVAACSNGTSERGVFAAGSWVNIIEYVTINTPSDSSDFGDLLDSNSNMIALESSTRGFFASDSTSIGVNRIEYITISTLANSNDYGDLLQGRRHGAGASNQGGNRGLFAGGTSAGDVFGSIEYLTLFPTGSGIDFGDLSGTRQDFAGTSNGNPQVMYTETLTPGTTDITFATHTGYTESLTIPSLGKVTKGQYASAGIDINGKLWTWGSNTTWGVLGIDTMSLTFQTKPGEPVIDNNSGWTHVHFNWNSCHGIRDGKLYGWGPNSSGALGVGGDYLYGTGGSTIWSEHWQWTLSASGTNEYYLEKNGGGDPEISEPSHWYQYTTPYEYYDKGTLGSLNPGEWNWGDNDSLGFNTSYIRMSSVTTDPNSHSYSHLRAYWAKPTQVGTDTNWVKVDGQEYGIAALKSDGTLWGFGLHYYGMFGHNPGDCGTYDRLDTDVPPEYDEHWSPVEITPPGKTIVDFSVGYYHTICIDDEGNAYSAGYDDFVGALGRGSFMDWDSTWYPVIGNIKFTAIQCHYSCSMGVGTDGKVYFWGYQYATGDMFHTPTQFKFGGFWP